MMGIASSYLPTEQTMRLIIPPFLTHSNHDWPNVYFHQSVTGSRQ